LRCRLVRGRTDAEDEAARQAEEVEQWRAAHGYQFIARICTYARSRPITLDTASEDLPPNNKTVEPVDQISDPPVNCGVVAVRTFPGLERFLDVLNPNRRGRAKGIHGR